MEFDFFLRVIKDKFNIEDDYRNLNFMFSGASFNLKKKSDSQILVQTDEVKLTIESSHSKIDKNDDSFASNISYINLTRVVIVKEINITKDGNRLIKVVELLLLYFHVLVFEESKNLNITDIKVHAIQLENVIINNEGFQVFCDPGTL